MYLKLPRYYGGISSFCIINKDNKPSNLNSTNIEDLNRYFSTPPNIIPFIDKLETIVAIENYGKNFDYPKFKFVAVPLREVKFAIHAVKLNARGTDGFSISFILPIIPYMLPALTHIITFCLSFLFSTSMEKSCYSSDS
jgi:hypothetical protein